jgi:hypothetical protein
MWSGLTEEMLAFAALADRKLNGNGEYTILLEPNVGDATSPILRYENGDFIETQFNQSQSDEAEDVEGRLVLIPSHWDSDNDEFVMGVSRNVSYLLDTEEWEAYGSI